MSSTRFLVAASLVPTLAPCTRAQCQDTIAFEATPTGANGFGNAVARSGGYALVAAYTDSEAALTAGAVFVFADENGELVQKEKLLPPIVGSGDNFGTALALDGPRAIIGSSADHLGVNTGAAFVYEESGGVWTHTATLDVAGQPLGAYLGKAIALEGDRAVIESARVLERRGSGLRLRAHRGDLVAGRHTRPRGSRAGQGLRLGRRRVGRPHRRYRDGEFGAGISLWGDSLLVGSRLATPNFPYAGAAYFFDLPGVGASAYCNSTVNSSGGMARISLECPGLLDGHLLLRAEPVPDTPGLFFYGPAPDHVPFANGLLCVDGPLTRLPATAGQGGVLAYDLDLASPAARHVVPGATARFQAWFRDPAGGGSATNLSDGLAVDLAP